MREPVQIRRMHKNDLPPLLLNMRKEDVLECVACGYTPLTAVHDAIASSTDAYTAVYDHKVLCCFGTIPHPESTPEKPITTVWLLSTIAVTAHPRAFYRASKAVVEILAAKFGNLTNFVHAPYERSRRWLKHLGFCEKGLVVGPRGDTFVLVVRPAPGFDIVKETT